jgi:hypothetical protein
VLEPQQNELVTYSTDVASFAAVKIAALLDKSRHGHVEKAESSKHSSNRHTSDERGWKIAADDHKFIVFLHRVEWRLPKQEDVTRVERVTIERGTARVA